MLALRDNKFATEKSWYSPTRLLSIYFFANRSFLKHSTERFLYKLFRYCETKQFDRKSWHNPLYHKTFRYPKLVQQGRVSLGIFLELWDKKSLKESCDTRSIPTCPQISSTHEVLWNAVGFPLRSVSVLRDKKNRQKIVT